MTRTVPFLLTLAVLAAVRTAFPTHELSPRIRATKTFTDVGGTLELRTEPLVHGVWSSSDPAVLALEHPGTFVGRSPGAAHAIFTYRGGTVCRKIVVRRDSRERIFRPFNGVTEYDASFGVEVIADELFVVFHAWVPRSERERALAGLGLTVEGEDSCTGRLTASFDAGPGRRARLMGTLLQDPRVSSVDVAAVAHPL